MLSTTLYKYQETCLLSHMVGTCRVFLFLLFSCGWVCLCVYIWKSEVDVGSLPHIFLRQGFTESGTHQFGNLVVPAGILVSELQYWDCRPVPLCLTSMC